MKLITFSDYLRISSHNRPSITFISRIYWRDLFKMFYKYLIYINLNNFILKYFIYIYKIFLILKIIFNSNKSVYDLIIVITTFGIKYSHQSDTSYVLNNFNFMLYPKHRERIYSIRNIRIIITTYNVNSQS